MDNPRIKNRIQKLREEISRLRFEYHVKNNPKITDDIYESLARELHNLEEEYPEYADPHSIINRVAGKPLAKFDKLQHKERMLSLNDAFSKEEVREWDARMNKLLDAPYSYFAELKLDGLAVSLIYKEGIFTQGATRGDGFVGEDITENLKMIETIPLRLVNPYSSYIEVRGEVVMPKRVWRALNKIQEKAGKPLFANTRNAAAGSLRQLDPKIVLERQLDFFAWDIKQEENNHLRKHSQEHTYLRELGFQVAKYEKATAHLKDVFSFIDKIEEIRENLPYGTDGIVISIDEVSLQEELGVVGKAPRYMVAYKYPALRATTTVHDITVNVGRTGVLTPLAHFTPTLVAGSTISKATLHNMDQIERLDIRIGDTVIIQKAGDVIPEVVEVLQRMRTGKEKKFKMPSTCPVCNFDVEKREMKGKQSPVSNSLASTSQKVSRGDSRTLRGGVLLTRSIASSSVAYYCTNKNCPAKNRRGIQHFVNIFQIYTLGPKILDRLKDEGLISDAADLFTLEESDLSGLERFGAKSAANIISSITSHKKITLANFVYALGIIHIGEETSRDIAGHFRSMEAIMKASREDFNVIPNIGPVVATSAYEYFNQEENLRFIEKLFINGVTIENPTKSADRKYNGITFVITGTFPTLSRKEVKEKILAAGGNVSSSVSKNTHYVIVGNDPGSKFTDAEKLHIPILYENEFIKMFS